MKESKPNRKKFQFEMGNGLILRQATRADVDALVAFNARIHADDEKEETEERVGAWTRDLLLRPHPTFRAGDFTIVEDTNTAKIVSSMNLISQTWSYGGIPFGVGRPELVGTDPAYRERGLIRAQFEVVHQWSEARGEKVQAITGIPYYYRRFGYEMALDLGGGRLGYLPHVPRLEQGKGEPYAVRPATEDDIPFIAELYERAGERYLVKCVRDVNVWRYELSGKSEKSVARVELRVIETSTGEPVGALAHPPQNWGPTLAALFYEVIEGVSLAEVTSSVIRYLEKTGKVFAEQTGKEQEYGAFGFWLGVAHPVYQVIPDRLPRARKPYAYYLRVPDLPGFIRHIAPFLEERLTSSPLAGHSSELKITFYRDGLRLVLERGRLVEVESWHPTPNRHSGEAAFPDLTFLQLLFGYRSLEELEYAFADCWTESDQAKALLNILFPKQSSSVWAVA